MRIFGKKKTIANESGCSCDKNCPSAIIDEVQSSKTEIGIKVLGSGCVKCNALERSIKEALEELGMDMTIEHVRDYAQIASYGVMSTPALVVDGKVVSSGKVLKKQEAVILLKKVYG